MNLLRHAIGESDEHIDEHELMGVRPQQNSSTLHFISSQLIYLINEANSQNRNIRARESELLSRVERKETKKILSLNSQ